TGGGAATAAAGDLALILAVAAGGSGHVWLLAPGLLLVGAGQGLWITPLTTTVLSFAEPQRAGVVSGTLSTMQQVGNSLGVALTGLVFFGTLRHGYNAAFTYALIQLAAALSIAAALTRLLRPPPTPPPRRAPDARAPPPAARPAAPASRAEPGRQVTNLRCVS